MSNSSVLVSQPAVGIMGGPDVGPRRPALSQERLDQFETDRPLSRKSTDEEEQEQWLATAEAGLARSSEFCSTHPQSATAAARHAQLAWATGRTDEAIDAAHRVLGIAHESFDPAAVYVAANVLSASGEADRVLEDLRALPPHRELEVLRASLLVDGGRQDDAWAVVAEVESGPAATLRGFIRLQQAKPAAAIYELRQAIRLSPDGADALMYMAHAYAQLGSTRKSLRYARQASKVAPGRRDVTYFLLDTLIGAGEFEAARGEVKKVQARNVTEPSDFLVLRARIALGRNQPQRAIALLRRAEALSTSDEARVELRANVATLRASYGDISQAESLRQLRKAFALAPRSRVVGTMLAESLPRTSDEPEVASVLEAMRAVGHKDEDLIAVRTHLAYLRAEFDETRILALEWMLLEPRAATASALACMLTGQLLDDWSGAAEIAVRGLNQNRGSNWLKNDVAYVLALAGRSREALELIETADATQYAPAATKGLVLVAAGRIQEGLRQYRRAAEMADVQGDDAHGRVLMTIHQAVALRRLGIAADDLADVRAAALPAVNLPQDWTDLPGFKLLHQVAVKHGWPWPVMIE